MNEEPKNKPNVSIAGQKVKEQGLVSEKDSVLNPEDKDYMNLSSKEKRQLEKEKLKAMGTKGKLQYIWMYYKIHMLAVILAIAGIFCAYDLYENSKYYNVLSLEVVNSVFGEVEEVEEGIINMLEMEDPYAQVSVGASLITDETGKAFEYNSQMAYVTRLSTEEIDVMIMPETLYNDMKTEEVFADLSQVLSKEAYESFGDSIDETHIILKDNELCEKLGIQYDSPCMCVMINSKNKENAAKWLESFGGQ